MKVRFSLDKALNSMPDQLLGIGTGFVGNLR